jgi:hypothetical protein
MTKRPSIKALQLENQHLRELVISLSAKLLRSAATQLSKTDRPDTSRDAERLVDEAEQCFNCARMPDLKKEVAEGLEVAGHELMARAVQIDTTLEREDQGINNPIDERHRK